MAINLLTFWKIGVVFATPSTASATPSTTNYQALELSRLQTAADLRQQIWEATSTLITLIRISTLQIYNFQFDLRSLFELMAFGGCLAAVLRWRQRSMTENAFSDSSSLSRSHMERSSEDTSENWSQTATDAASTDPGLLKKYSTWESYLTSKATYPAIRTFYRPHPHADKLPSKLKPMPLLVFIHGLGGSLAQFHPLMTSLVNVAPCLGIDLPGCGLSKFSPKNWEAYTIEALVELIAVIIESYREYDTDQGVILISHSLGCSLSALLASKTSPLRPKISQRIIGMIAICPKATPPPESEVKIARKLLCVPNPIFDIWRRWDRHGGLNSKSVARYVGRDADTDTKKLQVRFNEQSKTAVFRRIALGSLPIYDSLGNPLGGMPGREVWAGLEVPILLIAGEADTVTKPMEVAKIANFLGSFVDLPPDEKTGSYTLPDATSATLSMDGSINDAHQNDEKYGLEPVVVEANGVEQDSENNVQIRKVIKTSILPAPASHALLYDVATYRTVAGLIQSFLADHIDKRLSLGWQLQHLTSGGKWDVKNLAKWKAVEPVGGPIAGTFRAMKTLREIDEVHSPAKFTENWRDKIKAVVDISHESPVYNPAGLERGGVEYHKFPTVSKIPPTIEEVRDFINLVNRLLGYDPHHDHNDADMAKKREDHRLIGVHCHYGFNRTGFFISSYLIEQKGFSVQEAIEEFQKQRPPGIRHEHFIDALYVRYCVGLKRTPTF
ncbi:MAG: hypothetical protein M1834_004637 [Cirrosporium novae-zelandiae]|nr:MAG: hypothetical protein M1834_004637 [Cirrosporium novae-zelandiae]